MKSWTDRALDVVPPPVAGLRCGRRVRRAGVDARDGRDQDQCNGYPAHGSPLLGHSRGRGRGVWKIRIPLAVSLCTRLPETVVPKNVMSKAVSISLLARLPVDAAVEGQQLVERRLLRAAEA